MKVVVTGANGLVGSAFVRHLHQQGHHVQAAVRPGADLRLLPPAEPHLDHVHLDLQDPDGLAELLHGVDRVVHTAGLVSFARRDARAVYQVNTQGTTNLVNAMVAVGAPQLLHISSVAALGKAKRDQLDETTNWKESRYNSHYARSKYFAELEVWRAAAEGLEAVVVNPSVILGPGDPRRSSTAVMGYVLSGKPFYYNGTVNCVDLRDVVEMSWDLAQAGHWGERFILNGHQTTYQQLFAQVAHQLGRRPPRWSVPTWALWPAYWLENLGARLMLGRPSLHADLVRQAPVKYFFDNTKIKQRLSRDFRKLSDTVAYACAGLKI